MYVSTCTFVFVHPWVPSERCEIHRNIDRGLIYEKSFFSIRYAAEFLT